MADNYEYKPPKLHFVNAKGEYVPEHIPDANLKFMNWFRWKYISARTYFGKDLYYWHLRHNFGPVYRKTTDIEFIRHCVLVHDQNPEDPIERRHFKRAWRLYGHEMKCVLEEVGKDSANETKNEKMLLGHPYAYAYTKQWFNTYPEAETTLMYHGINISQYFTILDILLARAEKREVEYREEQGDDPVPSKDIVKKSKKSKSKT